jgi:hypothetical protein
MNTVLEARMLCIVQVLSEKAVKADRHADLSIAIELRLEALARLLKADTTRGWTMPGMEPGATSVNFDLLRAAAQEPVIEGQDGHCTFDADSFQRRVLAIADARASA